MQNSDTNGPDAVFAGLGLFTFLVLVVIWGVSGLIAWFVAPDDRRWPFFG